MFKVLLFVIVLFNVISCKPPTIAGSEEIQNIVPQCLPSQSQCLVETSVGTFKVTFSISPDHNKVITEVPFHIIVELIKPKDILTHLMTVKGYLEGKDMYMGKIPAFFSQSTLSQSKIEKKQVHIAEMLLGSCSEDIMTWRLWLTVELNENDKPNNKQTKTFFIDFDSHRYL